MSRQIEEETAFFYGMIATMFQKRILLIAILLILVLALVGIFSSAQAQNPVIIYFFWGDGCPHCAEMEPFLIRLMQKHPEIEVRAYEVWYIEANRDYLFQMGQKFGFEPRGVPTTFIGQKYWSGFSKIIGEEVEAAITECLLNGCPDAGQGLMPPAGIQTNSIGEHSPPPDEPTPSANVNPETEKTAPDPNVHQIDLPLFGRINLDQQSLTISTLLISFVDGFNPCSVWVLTMLLALTLHSGSRKKVIIIGVIFLTVTALVYALFIAGLFSVLKVVSFIGWVQVLVSVIALFFALVNIKDYFWYKEGISFTISDEQKPGIFQRIRRLMDASQSFWGLAGATVVMSAGVSLVEFSCTAGFPVLWTNLLVSQQVTAATFVFLLILYMLVYQLDELAIFFTAVFTLKSSRMEEKHGRILKLIGGMLMLTLAAVMLIKPSLLNSLSNSLLIFSIAFAATLLVLLVHRVILPRYGIWIGSEKSRPRRRKSSHRHH